MRISELYRPGTPSLSVEVFPPKTAVGDAILHRTLDELAPFRPAFISCTYGAGGSTRTRTVELSIEIQQRYGLTAVAHLTCVGSTRDELIDWLSFAEHNGIDNIMALRGDPPADGPPFRPVPGGLAHANELVSLIREVHPQTGVGVAGYPETHLETPDPQTDLDNLKRKVDAGADVVYTQMFYANEAFHGFRARYERAGIRVPLVPGIMPITDFSRIQRITSMCGATIPDRLAAQLEANRDDKAAQFEIGVEHAIRQCRQLIADQVPGIHFYALNRSQACQRILEALGVESSLRDGD